MIARTVVLPPRAKPLLLTAVVLLIAGSRPSSAAPAAPVERHVVRATLDVPTHWIHVRDEAHLASVPSGEAPWRFLLHRDLEILAVRHAGEELEWDSTNGWNPRHFWRRPPYSELSGYEVAREVEVAPPPSGWEEPVVLEVEYEGVIADSLVAPERAYGRSFKKTSGRIVDQGAFLAGSTFWVPWSGEGLFTFEVSVTGPADWRTVSQGDLIEYGPTADGYRMQWSCPHPMEEIYLIAGPYEVRERMHRGIRVMSFCYGNTGEDITDRYLDGTGAYLDLYGEMFGDYPFSKFALVENYWQTGYGMPSFTFLGDRVIRLPFILDTSYGHEILHNWWGNGVFVDVRGGNWCEGLTTYFADYLYKEVTGGSAGRDYRRDKLLGYRDFASGGGRDFPLSEFRQRDSAATQAVGYGKTMMVFHMLRTRLGEDVFLAGLRAVYRDHLFQEASWDDLRLSFEAVSGEDLAGWFDQWISRPGAIRLSVEGVAVQARGDSTVVSATLVQEEPCLETLVPVRVDAAGGEVARALIPMTGTRTAFEVAVHGSAEVLAVDPEFDIFRILHGEEIAPTLSGVLGADSTRIVIGKDVRPDIREALVAVAGEWAADSTISWVEEGTGTVEPDRGGALFFFGTGDAARDILSGISEGGGPESAGLGGGSGLPPGRSLVASWRGKDGGAVALFLPGSADEVAAIARKIPHYSKYSYLVFAGTKNEAKGVWSAGVSPLTVSLAGE